MVSLSMIMLTVFPVIHVANAQTFTREDDLRSAAAPATYAVHAPIVVSGNAGFVAANGVSSGSGTPLDPYVIQGWDINISMYLAPPGAGIVVAGTTASFVIRNNFIHDGTVGGVTFPGIKFTNVKNGVVQNNVLSMTFGVDVVSSTNDSFQSNQLVQNENGFSLSFSSFNVLAYNTVAVDCQTAPPLFCVNEPFIAFDLKDSSDNTLVYNQATGGIWGYHLASTLSPTTRNYLAHNNATSNADDGFILDAASGNALEFNQAINNSAEGFLIEYAQDEVVRSNIATNNQLAGFLFQLSVRDMVSNNTASGSIGTGTIYPDQAVSWGAGIGLFDTNYTTVVSNVAYNNAAGYALSLSTKNKFSSNIAHDNGNGFTLFDSSDLNVFTNNRVYGSTNYAGFYFDVINGQGGVSNTFTSNYVYNNPIGFFIADLYPGIGITPQTNETLLGNVIFGNNRPSAYGSFFPFNHAGVYIDGTSKVNVTSNFIFNNPVGLDWGGLFPGGQNLVYNNFFANPVNVVDPTQNLGCDVFNPCPLYQYNVTKTLRTNIVGGPYTGGNYWSDYAGTDTNGDELGDTLLPYKPGYNPLFGIFLGGDYFPLVFATGTGPGVVFFVRPTPLLVYQGMEGTFMLALVSQNGFAGSVGLTSTVSPLLSNGPNASLNSTSLSLVAESTAVTFLNVTNTIVPGSYTVTVTLTGSLSGSVPLSLTIVSPPLNPTTTAVSCIPSTLPIGQSSTCTVTVADTGTTPTTPTGQVTLTPGGTCTLSGTIAYAACSVLVTPSASGTLSVSASYDGDTTHSTSSTTTPFSLTVNRRSTSTTVVCVPSTVVVGETSVCTATVTDISMGTTSTPTGTITRTGGSCTLSGTGASASCTITIIPSAQGAMTIPASYGGDLNHLPSSGSGSLTVDLRLTSTTVNCVPASPSPNVASTCTATVTDTSPGIITTPTGLVTWTHTNTGSFSTPSCNLVGAGSTSSCLVTYTPTGTGSHIITGRYVGDLTHAVSSAPFTISVAVNPTATTVSCDTPVVVNHGSICMATVIDTSATGATTPTGFVAFAMSGITGTLPNCTLVSGTITGTATCTSMFTASTAGTAMILGSYAGDTTHATSSAPTAVSVTVNLRTTSITIDCSPTNFTIGAGDSTCTATVTDTTTAETAVTPTGAVTFSETGIASGVQFFGGSCIALTPTATAGTSTCQVLFTSANPGTASITANYDPRSPQDSAHSGSTTTTPVSVTVSPRTTTTTVTCSLSSVTVGGSTSCTAIVKDTSAGAAVIPSGTVGFSLGTGSTATGTFGFPNCTLVSVDSTTSSCVDDFTGSAAGNAIVSASYGGDTTHSSGLGSVSITVTPNAPFDYTLSVSPNSGSVVAGSSVTATVTATLTSGTAQSITFTISISPNPSVCQSSYGSSPCGMITFSPASVTPSSAGVHSTLTISTTTVVPVGTYAITITGSPAGRSSSSVIFTLTMTAPSVSSVNCGHGVSCSVQSNATLSNIRFAGVTVHFEADGPSGAHGYANVTVPKSDIPNINQLHVFVDNSKLSSSAVTVTSNSTDYFIYFTFTFHSPVLIDIQLSSPENAASPNILGLDPAIFYGTVSAIGAVLVAGLAVAYRTSKHRSRTVGIPRR